MDAQVAAEERLPLSYQQRMQIDFKVIALQPRARVAYPLCVFLGMFGAHRLYLGERRTGVAMLAIGITIIGLPVTLVWAIADLFRIQEMIDRQADAIRERLIAEATV